MSRIPVIDNEFHRFQNLQSLTIKNIIVHKYKCQKGHQMELLCNRNPVLRFNQLDDPDFLTRIMNDQPIKCVQCGKNIGIVEEYWNCKRDDQQYHVKCA